MVKADIPFGGVKHSGYGHELTNPGIQEFINKKVMDIVDIDTAFRSVGVLDRSAVHCHPSRPITTLVGHAVI